MSNFIQNLKEKPEAHRKKVTLIFSGSFAALAFVVFLIIFLGNFNEYSEMKSKEPKKESTLSKISKSYNDYKKGFDESELAKSMEGATFSKDSIADANKTTNATGTATTTISR